ncbi:MAG TPA: hypothetical protein VK497_00295 [Candidatus Saccharimonadales bacterium]|nr:hypothetical protein [Candidatus Saccharimonadales bacterium]
MHNIYEVQRGMAVALEGDSLTMPADADLADELGILAGFPAGFEPGRNAIVLQAFQELLGDGSIDIMNKPEDNVVELRYNPHEEEPKPDYRLFDDTLLSPSEKIEMDCLVIESLHAQLTTPEHLPDHQATELLHMLLARLDETGEDLDKLI